MRLQAGTRVGPYEVLSPIGSGGMGEVYRARDTRLDRTVAIKVLTTALAVDGDARDRFTREAKAISALNHPNICALYDVGQDGDIEFLVFELLEGETLAARLGRGPLPIREVVRFGMEIADALEAAHRQGIVHRDLKPGNIMLTASHVKLLDFGLAKRTLGLTGHARSTEETATQAATALGTVLGTLHYMAPEQLQGLPADARTDIFALGAVLYEMTSGRKAFDGATPPSVLAKILETEPTPVTTIAPTTPAALEQLIRACLTKERAERWQNVHDLLFQLRWIEGQLSASPPAHVVRGPARRERLAWTLVVATLAAAAWILVRPAGGNVIPRGAPSRTDVLLPPRLWLHEWADYPAISPDGRALVFAGVVDGIRKLYLRPLNEASVQPLPNTEGAYGPFWSDDSRSVGFFAGSSIRRVDTDGGRMITLGSYEPKGLIPLRRGTMNPANLVLFADGGTIWRAGDRDAAAVIDDAIAPAGGKQVPRFLPDPQRFIYFLDGAQPSLYVASLATGQSERVGDIPGPADYTAGHLLYTQGRTLMARPVEPVTLRTRGSDFPVIDGVVAAHFSTARNGTIAYRPAESELATLVWFDRSGARQGTLGDAAEYRHVALSPSGRRVAVAQGDPLEMDLWTADTATGLFTRVTTAAGGESDPTWSPDERSLAYSYIPGAGGTSKQRSAVRRLDLRTGVDQELADAVCTAVDDWTKDDRIICRNGLSMFAVPASEIDKAATLSRDFQGDQSHISPDGNWVAYNSRVSGAFEVYVAHLGRIASGIRVSVDGGVQPLWRRDGAELFYLTPSGTVMSVGVRFDPDFHAETPKPLFKTNLVPSDGWAQYAVTPDGQRFLVKEPVRQFFTVLQNWLPVPDQRNRSLAIGKR